ncbi:MAG: glycosyltransferase family 2 protein [Comamonadaceae bacterium]|nr:MAG: glycosyltransferase family 2 protein [Comamonadaceae bacterium]
MRVVVLMSTYKGEPWVREQVASILAQLPADGRLLIRDDGSPDATVDAIRGIADARLALTCGQNIGFVRSFLALLAQVPPDAEMVMFSDQDDVWLPEKVARAWAAIGESGSIPTLYCSRLQLVDTQLRPLGLSTDWPRPPSFENALAENVVTGCTAALNPAAVQLLREHGDVERIHFHDWWFYLVVAAFGRVVFDAQPTILYRQHGGNAIGMGSGPLRYWTILRFLRRHDWVHILFDQVENLRRTHGERLSPAQRAFIDRFFDPHDRRAVLRLLLAPRRHRQRWTDDVLLRLLIAWQLASGRGLLPRRPAR